MATDRPSEVEIRRALAECMTLGDIDDAMGWSPGTARRRRWRPLERGGLPSADAELGGAALWFRSTFESWQATRPTRSRDRPSGAVSATHPLIQLLEVPVPSQPPQDTTAAPPPAEAGEAARPAELTDDAAPAPVETPDEQRVMTAAGAANAVSGPGDQPDAAERADAPAGSMDGEQADSEASDGDQQSDDEELLGEDEDENENEEPATDENLPGVVSGFALASGQCVLADVHGQWREAWVRHRDRGTVVVD